MKTKPITNRRLYPSKIWFANLPWKILWQSARYLDTAKALRELADNDTRDRAWLASLDSQIVGARIIYDSAVKAILDLGRSQTDIEQFLKKAFDRKVASDLRKAYKAVGWKGPVKRTIPSVYPSFLSLSTSD